MFRQPLLSNTLTPDTYSVTFDTRKAWGSGESASTLQCKGEILRGKKKPEEGCCWLLESPQVQLPRATSKKQVSRHLHSFLSQTQIVFTQLCSPT